MVGHVKMLKRLTTLNPCFRCISHMIFTASDPGGLEASAKAQIDHDAVEREGHLQAHLDGLLEEDQGELLVRQG